MKFSKKWKDWGGRWEFKIRKIRMDRKQSTVKTILVIGAIVVLLGVLFVTISRCVELIGDTRQESQRFTDSLRKRSH